MVNALTILPAAISTHAPRTGSDTIAIARYDGNGISTHAPRTGSDTPVRRVLPVRPISTHAPRTGSDACEQRRQARVADFNPRSPHGERQINGCRLPQPAAFQPTLPARGATNVLSFVDSLFNISTHAPRTGSDLLFVPFHQRKRISTHAPRTGSDFRLPLSLPAGHHFNPRSPHGERQMRTQSRAGYLKFQPTLPARGATRHQLPVLLSQAISTHAPRTGSDSAK